MIMRFQFWCQNCKSTDLTFFFNHNHRLAKTKNSTSTSQVTAQAKKSHCSSRARGHTKKWRPLLAPAAMEPWGKKRKSPWENLRFNQMKQRKKTHYHFLVQNYHWHPLTFLKRSMFGTTAIISRVLLSSPRLRDRLLGVCTWALAHLLDPLVWGGSMWNSRAKGWNIILNVYDNWMDFLEEGHFGAYSNRANCSTSIDGLPDGTSLGLSGSFWSWSPSFLPSQALYTSHLFNRSMSNRWNATRFSSARTSTQFFFGVNTYRILQNLTESYRYRCNPQKDGIGIYCWFFWGGDHICATYRVFWNASNIFKLSICFHKSKSVDTRNSTQRIGQQTRRKSKA